VNFDRRIDDVAREMTAIESSAPLRERVLGRLAERPAAPWRLRVGVAATLASVVIVIVAAAVWPTSPRPASTRPVVEQATLEPTSMAVTTTDERRETIPSQPPAPETTAGAAVSLEYDAWNARALRPLDGPVPLVVEEIQPAAMAIPLLHVAPLPNEPVTVPPVTPIAPLDVDDHTGDS
jgi:hypothetical protein